MYGLTIGLENETRKVCSISSDSVQIKGKEFGITPEAGSPDHEIITKGAGW